MVCNQADREKTVQTLGEKEGCSDGCDYLLELISYAAGGCSRKRAIASGPA
jgi:hypothetical protein